MESKINPNDPAYPINIPEGHTLVNGIPGNGLTKREYFAGLAMQGLIAGWTTGMPNDEFKQLSELSTRISDAVLAELNKPVTP